MVKSVSSETWVRLEINLSAIVQVILTHLKAYVNDEREGRVCADTLALIGR